MNLNENDQSFALNLKHTKKSTSLRKKDPINFDTSDGGEFDNISRVSSPNTSFYVRSTQGKSFSNGKDESAIKLVKMESDNDQNDLTLPDINCKSWLFTIFSEKI